MRAKVIAELQYFIVIPAKVFFHDCFFVGSLVSIISGFVTDDPGNRFLLAVLVASASYITVPAAMKIAAPKANPGVYLPMALAVTFPINTNLGLPIYYWLMHQF